MKKATFIIVMIYEGIIVIKVRRNPQKTIKFRLLNLIIFRVTQKFTQNIIFYWIITQNSIYSIYLRWLTNGINILLRADCKVYLFNYYLQYLLIPIKTCNQSI